MSSAYREYMDKRIEQIVEEQKLDIGTAPGTPLSVIVQMETKDNLEEYLRASVEAIEMRRSVVSTRALVPPRLELLKQSAETGPQALTARGQLRRSRSASAESFLADVSTASIRGEELEAIGTSALQPLMDSDWVHEKVAKSEERHQRGRKKSPQGAGRRTPVGFVASGSAVLEMSRDELRTLPERLPQAVDVYVNRTVKVPPVAKAKELPSVVLDYKSNTWGLAKTGALASWGVFDAKGKGVKVAVLDTGVDAKHPDLAGRIAGFAEFDSQGRLMVDDVSKAYDSGEHGTHCCGTILGGRVSGRCIGMAPEAEVLVGLVLKNGVGTDAQILAGLEWALRKGAQVISMSLGGLRLSADVLDTYTRTIINANRLGIPVVVAAGNEGSQTTDSPGNDYFAFTVGAVDVDDRAAGFSGGRTQMITSSRYISAADLPLVYSKPEVSAPGVDIYSSVPKGKWETWNGTSMATPHAAGAMAILIGALPTLAGLNGAQRTNLLQTLLISTVKELGEAGQNHRFGYGRIDVLRALGYAVELGYGSAPSPQPPRPKSRARAGRKRKKT
jgi:subtilisin family serine protease